MKIFFRNCLNMQQTTVFFFFSLLFFTFCRFSSQNKLKIDMFTESLCPYCRSFLMESFKSAYKAKELSSFVDFNLYIYGNAQQTKKDHGWVFECQHGEKECKGNLMLNCALNLTQNKEQGMEFVFCFEENIKAFSKDVDKTGEFCSQSHDVDLNEIKNCMNSDVGVGIMHEIAVKTESLNPSHAYVPWITVNDEHSEENENEIIENMLQFICKKNNVFAACQTKSNFLKK